MSRLLKIVVAAAVSLVAACAGPPGPQGLQGEQGEPGRDFSGAFVGNVSFTGNVAVTGSISGATAVSLAPQSTAPASPADGTLYLDGATNTYRMFQGGQWRDLVKRAQRTISGFTGDPGPDLSREGFTQCYGWKNTGSAQAPGYTTLRNACGGATELVFAGYRAGEPTLVRHDVFLDQAFSNFLPLPQPSSVVFYNAFDPDRRFTWAVDVNYVLLAVNGNTWTDPGRLWEPSVGTEVTAGGGHVLSQMGNNTNDQASRTGDRYFIYLRQ